MQITPRQRFLAAALCVTLVPLVLYVAVTAYWRAGGYNAITGDEPHFLLITDSLANDHDVSLANNYGEDTPASIELGARLAPNDATHIFNGAPILGIGLPLLLTLPYAIAGVNGAKFFLAVLLGLTLPLVVFTSILPILKRTGWAALVTLAFVCALPFLAASNQIYTDLVAGVLILHATSIVVGMFLRRELQLYQALLLGIELAFLPWLYYRYLPPAFVILIGALAVVWSVPRDRRLNASLGIGFVLVLTSWVGLALYNLHAFNNPLGMFRGNTVSYSPLNIGMVFAGLHWDSFQGMFGQQPLLWFALLGIVPFVRANWRAALLVALVYLACLVPASLHPNWYGGASFAGRYMWAAISLWVFPLAYAVAALLQYRRGRAVMLALCGASFLWQGALATIWLPHNHFLYNEGFGMPIWTTRDLFTPLFHLSLRAQYRLPSFRDPAYYMQHVPNYLIALFSVLLIAGGAYLAGFRNRYLFAALWGTFAVVCIAGLAFYTPSIKPVIFRGSELPGSVGKNETAQRVAVPGSPGYLTYGPYIDAYPGRTYRLELAYTSGEKVFANYDMALDYGKIVFEKDKLPPAAGNQGKWRRVFRVPPETDGTGTPSLFEFRLLYHGRGKLAIERLTLSPEPD